MPDAASRGNCRFCGAGLFACQAEQRGHGARSPMVQAPKRTLQCAPEAVARLRRIRPCSRSYPVWSWRRAFSRRQMQRLRAAGVTAAAAGATVAVVGATAAAGVMAVAGEDTAGMAAQAGMAAAMGGMAAVMATAGAGLIMADTAIAVRAGAGGMAAGFGPAKRSFATLWGARPGLWSRALFVFDCLETTFPVPAPGRA